MEKIIEVSGLKKSYGQVEAVKGIDFYVEKGSLFAFLGPNGAGKTSLLSCINGYYMPQEGMILFNAINLKKVSIFNRTKMGIARTFQNVELFNGATALDNILAARHIHYKTGVFMSSLYYGKALHEEIHHREIVEDIIDFLEIKPIRKKIVGSLPYGMRKRVELARALAIEPTLLLLDEPMAGMNVEEKEDMARFVIDIFEEKKIPIILIEHDMGVVMDISDRVVVLDFGKKIAEGTPEQIMHSEKVINAYLGQ